MKIFVRVDAENNVKMWGSNRSDDDEIELDIEDNHSFLTSDFRNYSLVDNNELVENHIFILNEAKRRKNEELNKKCNESILNGFYHMINGIKYHFSYDSQAQVNFGDAREILNDGVVDSMDWTVSTGDGYERIKVKKEDMDGLTISIFVHKQENIGRYRDVLLPLVREAKTIEEVNNVTWDYEEEN